MPFLDLFQGRDELIAHKHMWYDGAPHQGRCEGCTTAAWHAPDAAYLTYATTGRGIEAINPSLNLLDRTPYGRGERWEDNPEGWPEGRDACWSWRSAADGSPTWGPTSRPVPQWDRPGATPEETLGRRGHH
ncbi:DUF899 family protein [Actinokineospora auranticolor]|uniref:Uncharacterized protein DUF899 n=1 Tax=Actinokineospora auranticolor TaxID=155976 RepID=A0A2S6GT88_9PSEU|nr:DUF899 family protein [Actinokineospora auranticolor]PPK68331.1 uncharacterized protein DUF899 [Actinokineospora auranticolor]